MELVGKSVKKEFLGLGILSGIVKSFDPFSGFFEIVYEDGDSEEMEFMEVASILEGTVEDGVSEPIYEKRVWRKPKKRRRDELLRDGSGNSIDSLMKDCCSREGFEETQVKDGLGHGEFLETLEKECGVDGNTPKSCSINGNLDENVRVDRLNLNVDVLNDDNSNKNVCSEEELKPNTAFDEKGKGSDSVRSAEEPHKKEHGFDLNLMFHVETEGNQMMEIGVDGVSEKIVLNRAASETHIEGGNSNGSLKEDNSSEAVEEAQVNASSGFGDHVMGEACLRTNEEIQNEDRYFSGDSKGNSFGVCEATRIEFNDGANFHLRVNSSDVVFAINHGDGKGLDPPDKEEHGRKKRIRLTENLKATARSVLRRSTRRASSTFSALDHASSTENSAVVDTALLPHEINVTLDKKSFGFQCEGIREQDALPPKLELPPASKNLDVDEIPILDLFSVYVCLRSFSTLLFLSPFDVEAFVEALKCKFPNSLIDSIHFSILQTLKLHLEFLSEEGSRSATDCLRNLNWGLLDLITWPIYMVEYLLIRGLGLKPGFQLCHLTLLNGDYYKQPSSIKLEILRCLCDDVLEAETVRSELNRRTLASDLDMDVDWIANVKTKRKRKDQMDNGGGSCLTQEAVDETADWNSDECCLCKMDGSLICCDGCPAAYHTKCVGITKDHLPEGDWYCPECVINRSDLQMKSTKYLRGAELLGIDPYGRIYFGSCGYLLVSDSCEPESSYCYYNRNDLNAVLEVLKSSYILYGGIISAICMNWDIPVDSTGSKDHPDSQFNTVCKDLDVDGQGSTASFSSIAVPPSEIIEVKDVAKHEGSVITEDVHHPSYKAFESVSRPDSVAANNLMERSNPLVGSGGFTEISQAIECSFNQKNEADCSNMPAGTSNRSEILEETHSTAGIEPTGSVVKLDKNIGATFSGHSSAVINLGKGVPQKMLCEPGYYVNYYTFAQSAASVAEELMHKSSDNKGKDSEKSVEEIISAQMMAILKKSTNFCWSNIQRLHKDAQKENCGWCVSCRMPNESGDCLFNIADKKLVYEDSKGGAVGLRSKKNKKSHLFAIIYHILSLEERLSGLLSGPWQNPLYSKHWRKSVLKATDVSSLKQLLLVLESNLRHVALSADWLKQVDSVVTMGSASHVLTNSVRVSSTKSGSGRKRARFSDAEVNSSSNASSRSGVFWWRGGKVSGQLFHWKVLPHSLASKGGRQAGCRKIPGIFYPDGSEFAKRSKYVAWRAAVEMSTSVPQLACQIRELDSNIRWDNLENTPHFSHLTKEAKKLTRLFKKVTIRRKCIEGATVKYLLDFGKRKTIPDTVTRNGIMLEVSSSERRKFWLDESHVPLHLLKAFEEKKLSRMSNKTNSGLPDVCGKVVKRPSRKKGLLYLLSKGEQSEYYQCGHCNKEVLIRDAVSCQDCQGFFHKRHVRKSERTSAECTYTCHKCQANKNMKKSVKPKSKKGKLHSQKIKKVIMEGRPKRLVKKVNYAPLQSKKIGGMKKGPLQSKKIGGMKKGPLQSKKIGGVKKGKWTKSRKGQPKKTKKSICWHKGKRTWVYHAYWLNGLRLTRKINDVRVRHFRERKLILSNQYSDANVMQPICCLCCEVGYRSELTYISCENCQEWFHGEAFGLTSENSDNVIGFRCHKCLKRNPPVCPYLQDVAVNEAENHKENDAGIEYVKVISVTDKLPSEKDLEQKISTNDDSMGLLPRYEPVHKKQKTDAIYDSILMEKKTDAIPVSIMEEQKIVENQDSNHGEEPADILDSNHNEQKEDRLPDSKHDEQKADAVLDSNQTPMFVECESQMEKELETVQTERKEDKISDSNQTHILE